jgi:hypothetical protein
MEMMGSGMGSPFGRDVNLSTIIHCHFNTVSKASSPCQGMFYSLKGVNLPVLFEEIPLKVALGMERIIC